MFLQIIKIFIQGTDEIIEHGVFLTILTMKKLDITSGGGPNI